MKRLVCLMIAVIMFACCAQPTFAYSVNGEANGDVDTDGVLSIMDATYVQRYIASIIEISEEQRLLCDADCNNSVDVLDATLIQLVLACRYPTLPIQKTVEVPAYWRDHLVEKSQQINDVIAECSENSSSFFWYNDAHWTSNSKSSPYLLRYLNCHTEINKTNFGGDIVGVEADVATEEGLQTMSYLFEWREMIADIPNHHSIIGNHDDGNKTNNLFSDEYIYSFLLEQEQSDNIVKSEGFYYYIDDEDERTRYLYLDSAYRGATNTQLDFLEEALLSAPENYHFVVLSHIWYEPDYANYNIRPLPIEGLHKNALKFLEVLDSYNLREGVFADCTGYVEFCIGGHVHIDYIGYSDSGIPIIITESDSMNERSNYISELYTTSESSVNAVVTDYDKRQISIIRVGRGEDITVKY